MIELPFPAAPLWPNSRSHWAVYARAVKQMRGWAKLATLADATRPASVGRIVATLYPKSRGPMPDRDNTVAALKSTLDGIADAYGVNDRDFPVPIIQFGERTAHGRLVVHIEEAE